MTEFNPDLYKPENIDEGDYSFSTETPWLERATLAVFSLFGIPETFLDVGCGMGQTVFLARKLGVEAEGVELHPREGLVQHDLRSPLTKIFKDGAEMVFCWEVGEHLPEEYANVLCKSISDNMAPGGILVWTAAIPGQPGLGHINCQLPYYWLQQFGRVGLRRSVHGTAALAFLWEFACGGAMYHLRQNLNVFVK